MVYELVLQDANGRNVTGSTKTLQKFILKYSPANATVLIDNVPYYGNKGRIELDLPVNEEHTYIITAEGFSYVKGIVTLSPSAPRIITETLIATLPKEQQYDKAALTHKENTNNKEKVVSNVTQKKKRSKEAEELSKKGVWSLKSKDYQEAVKCFVKAAELGSAGAQNQLGYCYENGLGVEQDYSMAVEWYRKAAEKGFSPAQYSLGQCYYYGQGVSQSYSEAVKWYRMAAERGDASAQTCLAYCYENGQGVTQDNIYAFKWYQMAANNGSSSAARQLKRLMEKLKQ